MDRLAIVAAGGSLSESGIPLEDINVVHSRLGPWNASRFSKAVAPMFIARSRSLIPDIVIKNGKNISLE